MATESQYSPVHAAPDGSVSVALASGHPGFADPEYRRRRDAIAALSYGHGPGEPIAHVDYTDREHGVWAVVSRELAPKHRGHAVGWFVDAVETLALPADRIPQLVEVSARLAPVSGFRYEPVAGLAPLRTFYGSFDDGVFFSTQYIRHHSSPLYTPEPDIVHEVIGHAHHLADPQVANLYRLVGAAVARVETDLALRVLSKVFWFTFEFGVVDDGHRRQAYGAGILSSFGEMDAFRSAATRPFDIEAMARADYDITRYQPVLFAGRTMEEVFDCLEVFFTTFDDDAALRLAA
jgi:phenylalanine-4-hydroxylase